MKPQDDGEVPEQELEKKINKLRVRSEELTSAH